MISVIVFARLLTPAELGIFAIATGALIIINELKSLGVEKYLIREKEITPDKLGSALIVTIFISWSLGLLLLLTASHIANFYDIPELQLLFYILSINFLFSPFNCFIFSPTVLSN